MRRPLAGIRVVKVNTALLVAGAAHLLPVTPRTCDEAQ
jgi:hypothetical protein